MGAPGQAPAAAGKFADRPATGPGSFRPRGAAAAAPPPPAPKKKKRRVRTKQCSKCMTPCVLLTRARLDRAPVWYMICDICWARFCDTNPDYVYGGTWMNGRIMDPVHPQGGGHGPSGLVPHHIHGPQIVRQRAGEMDDDEDGDEDEDDAPAPPAKPAFRSAPKPAAAPFQPKFQAPKPPPVATKAQLMGDIEAIEAEDGGEDGDESDGPPESGAQPQGQPGQPGEGGRKKRRRRRKRKGGGGGQPNNGGAPTAA